MTGAKWDSRSSIYELSVDQMIIWDREYIWHENENLPKENLNFLKEVCCCDGRWKASRDKKRHHSFFASLSSTVL